MSKRSRRKRPSQQSTLRRALTSHWTWLTVGVLLIGGGLFTLYLQGQPPAPKIAEAQARADAAPDFELISLDNEAVSLSDYRGQVVLVNFWATWCPPCRAELPDLVGYYHDHATEGFILLGINEQESAQQATAFLNSQGLDFPVLLDETGSVMGSYGVSAMPSSFLIDKSGQIVQMWTGMINRQTLEEAITPLLQG